MKLSPYIIFALATVLIFCSIAGNFLQSGRWLRERIDQTREQPQIYEATIQDPKLCVIVPVHEGDLDRAINSISRWPTRCSQTTLENVDIVIYHAEELRHPNFFKENENSPAKCFRSARAVSAKLRLEENIYPKGPSVQFYKLFLDPDVRKHFVEYDALAIVEWDVTIAHETSFERLYNSAFTNGDPFWVKGSILMGNEFHGTASLPEKWHILGHVNGNAIYNNTDPAFVEYVNFTLNRWQFMYPYDVSLWATIADFPYSWPLWQRYAKKFVGTNLIANIGFLDVKPETILSALSMDTLFIHGRLDSGGSLYNSVPHVLEDHSEHFGCKPTCGSSNGDIDHGRFSMICDSSCLDGANSNNSRSNPFGCGAADASKYGKACRLCVKDPYDVLAVKHNTTSNSSELEVQAFICPTKTPVEAIGCSQECNENTNTICDKRCGHGEYGDWHCNWRSLGDKCRFCFHDLFEARLADQFAHRSRGRVIMCDTHNPPHMEKVRRTTSPGNSDDLKQPSLRMDTKPKVSSVDSSAKRRGSTRNLGSQVIDTPAEFINHISKTEICAFMPGYFEFLYETKISFKSIEKFMPGMKMAIATHPSYYHVFRRTLGQAKTISVVNTTHTQYAALMADEACGNETQLIYYMAPGSVLARPFTSKDIHSTRGDLIVEYTSASGVSSEHARRTMATAMLLGFHSPSFTYGTDIILPVAVNNHLRSALRGSADFVEIRETHARRGMQHDMESSMLYVFLEHMSRKHQVHVSIHIPELLAAYSYSQAIGGVEFINPEEWNSQHIFRQTSIWDVPLIKPRFGCSVDVSLSLKGYDIAKELGDLVDAFGRGAKCGTGFISVDPSNLNYKPNWTPS